MVQITGQTLPGSAASIQRKGGIVMPHDLDAPLVELPAPESYFEGDIGFKGKMGWANDWLTGWNSTSDRVWWRLDVVNDGRYEITLRYACPEANVGSRIQVEVGGETLAGALSQPHDPDPIPSPDRAPRGEVYEKEWARLKLGTVGLRKGETKLTVRATDIRGTESMDVKAVDVRRVG